MTDRTKKNDPLGFPWGFVGRTVIYLIGFLILCFYFGLMNSNNSNLPWSSWGLVGRTVVYLIGLLLLCFLFGLLRSGGKSDSGEEFKLPEDQAGREATVPWPETDPYEKDRSKEPVRGWNDSLPGVRELPPPERNYIPPSDSTRITPNPEDSVTQVVAGQAIVLFNSKDLNSDMGSFAQQYKELYPADPYEIKYYNLRTGVMLIGFPDEELTNILDNLPGQISGIDFKVVTNDVLAESYVPSDPGFKTPAYDEYYKLIQAYDAWDVTKGSPDIKVAIIDSYFDLNHPLLKDRYVNPINIVTQTTDVYPPAHCPKDMNELGLYCHGSHVAALAIGAMDNGVGCAGIAPECTWIPISIGDQMSSIALIEAILYAIYQGADVVNFSIGAAFGPEVKNLTLEEQSYIAQNLKLRGEDLWDYVVKVANDHNCALVTAAGNDAILMGLDSKNRNDGMIKVEAVDGKGKVTDFSNFGSVKGQDFNYSTVAAPGMMVWSATDGRCTPIWEAMNTKVDKEQALQEMPGTSMAAPIVAGAVALMKSKNKDITTEEVIKILKMTGKKTDPDKPIGPTIQIRNALDAVGGEYANFDDLMKDHNLLVGKWKSTNVLDLMSKDGNKIDELWAYFIFDTPSVGHLEFHSLESQRIYKAPLSVTWKPDCLLLTQKGDAVSDDGDRINPDDFTCAPNQDRLLETVCSRNGKQRYTFLLQKTN